MDSNNKVLQIATNNDLACLTEVEENANLTNGRTLLVSSIEQNNPELAEKLLKEGADASDPMIIEAALENDHDWAVLMLLKYGANPNHVVHWDNLIWKYKAKLDFGSWLVHIAVAKHNMEMMQILVSRGADLSKTDQLKRTALHVACQDLEIPEALILYFINQDKLHDKRGKFHNNRSYRFLNSGDVNGTTPLIYCCKNGNVFAAKLLIEKAVNLNTCDKMGKSALHYAIDSENEEITKLLLNSKADVNIKGTNCCVPLHIAVEKGNVKLALMLMDSGADHKVLTKNKENVLYLAVSTGNQYLVEKFVSSGLDVNRKSRSGQRPLSLAAICDDGGEMVQLLISHGANIEALNSCDYGRETALCTAIANGETDNARVLVSECANFSFNRLGAKGALNWSIDTNNANIFQLLLIAGATFKLQNIERYPEMFQDDELKEWLMDFIAKPRTLRSLCVNTIRRQCKKSSQRLGIGSLVKKLPLPEALKKAVMLKDA